MLFLLLFKISASALFLKFHSRYSIKYIPMKAKECNAHLFIFDIQYMLNSLEKKQLKVSTRA